MNMPGINISFTEKAATAIQRGERGIIAMIIKGAVPATNPLEILSAPSLLSVDGAGVVGVLGLLGVLGVLGCSGVGVFGVVGVVGVLGCSLLPPLGCWLLFPPPCC